MTLARTKHLLGWVGMIVAGLAVITLVVTAVGVYGFGWRGPKTTAWTRYTPLPAATVGWQAISLHHYFEQYQAITHYNDQLTSTSPQAFPAHAAADNARVAMSKVVRDVVMRQTLRKFKLSVSATDIAQAYQAQLTQSGNPTQVAGTIKELYGWTPEQFQQNVIWSVVAQDKIQQHLSFDPTANQSAQRQADNVLAQLKAGQKSFEDVAKSYSDDVYGAKGGDLGFIAQGSQISEIDGPAFSLPIGQISSLLHSKYGWHIIKVTERKTVDGQTQSHLFEIFIAAPSVDQYLTNQTKSHRVLIWMGGLRFNQKSGQVVTAPSA